MAFVCTIEKLLQVLHARSPALADALALEKRRVINGMLSVGLKIHGMGDEEPFERLFVALGGRYNAVERYRYRKEGASFCLVLPPVGSADAAITLIDCMSQFMEYDLFSNDDAHLQVCTPGRLSNQDAALYAAAFYLGSDTIRCYRPEDYCTTVSLSDFYRGRRIVLYDANVNTSFDGGFGFWTLRDGALEVRPVLPFLNQRTDILSGPTSRRDVRNINLIGTLLIHGTEQHADGFWHTLGKEFRTELIELLHRHKLASILQSPWVRDGDLRDDDDTIRIIQEEDAQFAEALRRLIATARDDAHTLTQRKWRARWAEIAGQRVRENTGLLVETNALLDKYFQHVHTTVDLVKKEMLL